MRLVALAIVSACVLATGATPLVAQVAPDSITASFHQGEWGVGFVQGRSLTEGGVLHFSTPTRAWVLDGAASFDRQVIPEGGIFGSDVNGRNSTISALLGPRWYRGLSARVARFAGFGITGGYANAQFAGSASRDRSWSVGAYGELGVQYMFTRHVGIGWRGNVVVSRAEDRVTQVLGPTSSTQRAVFYHVALEPVQVIGTIYF